MTNAVKGVLAACWFFLSFAQVDGHSLGEHKLNGASPTGDPPLPEISGAFNVKLTVRYNNLTTDYQSLFQYTNGTSDTIWFGHQTATGALMLHVEVGGVVKECSTTTAASAVREVYTIQFGVDASSTAHISVDGVQLVQCADSQQPINIPRSHYIGESTFDSNATVQPLEGAILGLRVTNLGSPTTMLERFRFQNLPGQPRGNAFVASFYARFDNVQSDRYYQRVFDFGNGAADNNIFCGQYYNYRTFLCAAYQDGSTYMVYAHDVIDVGQFAFWHFGLDEDGTMWLEKDGARIATASHGTSFSLAPVFRKSLLFGKSNWQSASYYDLDGAVLGFRLDSAVVS